MLRTYSAVRVQNPTSLQQLVKIHPGQDILLYLDDEVYGGQTVEVSSEHLKLTPEPPERTHEKFFHCYRISHSLEVREWAAYSSTLIGEIWIDGKKSMGKVGVLLETTCPNKSHIRTVVNPDCMDLRIYPYNVIELIVYDLKFGYHDEWNCEWRPLIEDLGLQQIGYDHLCLHSWDVYYNGLEPNDYLYSRYPRADVLGGLMTRQHHFWFRFDPKIFEVTAKNNGLVCAGNIVVNGLSNRFQLQYAEKRAYHVALYIDCRKKHFQDIQTTLNLKLRDETAPGLMGKPSYGPRQVAQTVKEEVLPTIRDIGIKLLDKTDDLTDCKMLPTLNDSYRASAHMNMWYDEDDFFFDTPYHHRHHPNWWRKWN